MRELFLQIVYGRTQSAFSEDGLPVGAGLEDLGKGLRSQVGTMYGTLKKGPRYLEMAGGLCNRHRSGCRRSDYWLPVRKPWKDDRLHQEGRRRRHGSGKGQGHYGQFDNAAKYIDPRQE